MRPALAALVLLALAAQPALAQKTKSSPTEEAVAALEVCESFARGDVLAVDDAIEKGWDAYDQDSESPFVRSYAASRDLAGLGWADLFVLVETYPSRTLGYCRLDLAAPVNPARAEAIAAIAGLDRYTGETETNDVGTYAALSGTGDADTVLMTHWDDVGFVVQLTILTPKVASGDE